MHRFPIQGWDFWWWCFRKTSKPFCPSNSFVKLISMILEGGETSCELPAGLQKISVNLYQLVRFNSVKQKCGEGTQKFCHSNNEPPLPVLNGLMVHARTGKRMLVDRQAAEGASISYEQLISLFKPSGSSFSGYFQVSSGTLWEC